MQAIFPVYAILLGYCLAFGQAAHAEQRLECSRHEKFSYGGSRDTRLVVGFEQGQPVSFVYNGYFNATGQMGDGHPCGLELDHKDKLSRWITRGKETVIFFKAEEDGHDTSRLHFITDGKTMQVFFDEMRESAYCGGDAEFPLSLRLDGRGRCTAVYPEH